MSDLKERLGELAKLHVAWDKFELNGEAPPALVEGETARALEQAGARIRELEAERDALLARVADFEGERSEILMNAQTLTQEQIDAVETATIEHCVAWLRIAPENWTPQQSADALQRLRGDPESFRAIKPKETT